MISREEAIAIASARLEASGWDSVVTEVTERDLSWVVGYQPRKYLETNDIRHVLYGCGPMVISNAPPVSRLSCCACCSKRKTGGLTRTGSCAARALTREISLVGW